MDVAPDTVQFVAFVLTTLSTVCELYVCKYTLLLNMLPALFWSVHLIVNQVGDCT